MALIGKIRKNSWLLIVVLGLGLVSFIMMDMMGAGGQGGASALTMGEVNGEEINYNKFQRAEQLFSGGGDGYGTREYLWQHFFEEKIVGAEADALGLSISDAELDELQFGNNLSPIVRQRVSDPQTGQVDRASLANIKNILGTDQVQPQQQAFWDFQKTEVKREALAGKLTDMISKGLYTPKWMVEQVNKDQNTRRDFAFVKIPFDQVDDSEVELTDADYKNYFNEHKGKFYSDNETRDIDYVIFDVVPTSADSAIIYDRINGLRDGLLNTSGAENFDDSTFVQNNYGTMDAAYVNSNFISPVIKDQVTALNVGEAYGPYLEGKAYKMVKLVDSKTVADSVDSRHILRKFTTQAEAIAANTLIDSLMNVLNNGGDFDALAKQFSEDGSAAAGGNLGYYPVNGTVKQFNDILFYTGEKGKFYKVATQFGLHIIEILGRKFTTNSTGYKLAYLSENIVPSEETQNAIFEKADAFIEQNRSIADFAAAAESDGNLTLETANNVANSAYNFANLGQGQASRDIIKWAFDNETNVGEVTPTVFTFTDEVDYYKNKFVATAVKAEHPKGQLRLEDVKSTIEPLVRNYKKGELLKSQITASDIGSIASQYSTTVDTARSAAFALNSVGGIGNEPKAIAAAFNTDLNAVSNLVVGNNGFFVVQPISSTDAVDVTNVTQVKNQATASLKSTLSTSLLQALKRKAKVADNRFTYY